MSKIWKAIDQLLFNPPKSTFLGDYISALRGAAPSNFYMLYN